VLGYNFLQYQCLYKHRWCSSYMIQFSNSVTGFDSVCLRNKMKLPQKIVVNEGMFIYAMNRHSVHMYILDFTSLKVHYHTILQFMPEDYEQCVGKLQDYINDDQMCMILSCTNITTAKKIILDCLIERMSYREDLLDLCDQLEKIATSNQLSMLITELRSGVNYCAIYMYRTTQVQCHTLLSTNTHNCVNNLLIKGYAWLPFCMWVFTACSLRWILLCKMGANTP